jgi:hypothetical protein
MDVRRIGDRTNRWNHWCSAAVEKTAGKTEGNRLSRIAQNE